MENIVDKTFLKIKIKLCDMSIYFLGLEYIEG